MNILNYIIAVFIILELLNVVILYFAPNSKKGNGVAVFNAYNESKNYKSIFPFIEYLVNWVAGTKLIFILLLIVILIYGDNTIKVATVFALILSISTFFWRLYPIIKSLDHRDGISPKGYSKSLAIMIMIILILFLSGLLVFFYQ